MLFSLLYTVQVNSACHAPLCSGSEHKGAWLLISKTYFLRAAEQTKSVVNNLISDYFLVYWQEYTTFSGFCVVYTNMNSPCGVDIYLHFGE